MSYDLCQACNLCPPTQPGSWMCDPCRDRLHEHLHAILGSDETPGLAHELDLEVAKLSRKGSHGKTTSPTPALPYNPEASHCLDLIRWKLLAGCALVAGALPPVPNTIPDLGEWLLGHEDKFAMVSGCGPIADDLDQLTRRARRIIDVPPERVYVGTCPCGTRLMAIAGNEYVRCRGCGTSFDAVDSRDALLASVADQWQTVDEIAALLGRKRGTVWNWADRGHLERHPDDARRFRLGDAVKLAERKPAVS